MEKEKTMANTLSHLYFATFCTICICHDVCNIYFFVEVTVDSIRCNSDLLK
jgi:hypothetical protein